MRILRALLLAALAAGLVACERPATPRTDETAEFLAGHWRDPIAPQGNPPARFSTLEASLDPESCGQCHASQFQDWQSSLHARAMGPGILWQLHTMGPKAANSCLRCHAPLAEQKALLAMERGWENAPASPPPAYVPPGLHRGGLVCAACHVRGHARFGPPPREGSPEPRAAALPHGGFSSTPAFQDSRFCSHCHQFAPDGSRLNGKLLQDTYEEWRASAAAAEGKTCQSCHMPGRRHLWRGIHDPAMVREALAASLEVSLGPDDARARARLANVGAGHHFPTYVIPEVVAILRLVDASGAPRTELARRVIGRSVNLRLTEEIFDNRLPAGGHVLLESTLPPATAKGWSVELLVLVHPARHYERVFREALEQQRDLPPEARTLLRQALAAAEGAGYELYRIARPVPVR